MTRHRNRKHAWILGLQKINRRAVLIACMALGISLLIATTAKPAIINFYFDHHPARTINETLDLTKITGYGKVFVIAVETWYITNENIYITDIAGQTKRAQITNKLNCIPEPGHNLRVAGAWNPGQVNVSDVEHRAKDNGFEHILTSQELNFYAVWIINGCEKKHE